MQIIVDRHGGFCPGVEKSIRIAEEAKEKYGDRLFSLHPLIHNAGMVKKLAIPQKNLEEVQEGDAILISAHGVGKDTYSELKKRGAVLVDGTCSFISFVHEQAEKYSRQGYSVIICGDKNHAEIKGIAGFCKDCQVIRDETEIDWERGEKYLLLAQSTLNVRSYEKIEKKVSENAKKLSKTLASIFTICYTTKRNQKEAERIASRCQTILVVGDRNSANCRQIVSVAGMFGAEVHLIENVDDVKSLQIKTKNTVLGILAGASTPKELIMEVFYSMEEKVIDSVTEEVKENTEATATVAEVPVSEVAPKATESMAEALEKYASPMKSYREGMRLKVRVISVDPTGISVAIEKGGKNDSGFIAKEEAEIDGSFDPSNYQIGSDLEAIIIPKEAGSKNNAINLSKKAYDQLKADDEKVTKILEGEEFTLDHTQEIKGGLLGKIGTYSIFIPASQIKSGFVSDLSEYTNKTLRLKVLPAREEVDEEGNPRKRNPKRIVASQRVILEAEKAQRDEEFWSKIYVGAIVSGKVKRFAEFGAFVSLKHMDGLVHSSDLSWNKRRDIKPSDILELNKVYDFIVISVDRENNKIGLGYKQLQKKPIEIAQEKYPVGTIVEGKVVKLMKYGVFVELEPGLDGLVHISQVQRGFLENINDATVKDGDMVKVKVMSYDNEKITLSIKEALPVEEPVVEVKTEEVEEVKKEGKFAKDKKGKKGVKEEVEDEGPHNFVSGGSNQNLASLFSGLKIETADEETKAEEDKKEE